MAERTMNRPPARPATAAPRGEGMARSREFVSGLVSEMRRVTWPSRQEWVSATVLTVILVVAVGLFTSGCDWIFTQLFVLLRGGAV
ncbi:MAG: preprotein translocase subunit SecE [Candidatus Eremiobacteraeota bacterium]|nr:preprotein translocase subunit SecE [Candidatus Eremiobacteraeota bacterium]